MKILMLADVFFPDTVGGAGRFLYHLSLELSRKGHEIHIITRNTNGKLAADEKIDNGLFVHRFSISHIGLFGFFLSEIKNSYVLAKRITKDCVFDLVCIHQSLVALGPILARSVRQIPIVYQFQSPWHEEFLIKNQQRNPKAAIKARAVASVMRLIENRVLSKTAKILVLSQYMGNKLLEIHHCSRKKITRIPGGVELDRFCLPSGGKTEVKIDTDLPQDRTIFLTVRNLVPRMGIDNLIEAFHRSKILRQKGLLLIGGKGLLEDRLKSMVEN